MTACISIFKVGCTHLSALSPIQCRSIGYPISRYYNLQARPTLLYSLAAATNSGYRRLYPAPASSSPTTRPQSHNEVYPSARRKTCILRRGFVDETKRSDEVVELKPNYNSQPSEALGKKRKEKIKLKGVRLEVFAFLARFQTVVRVRNLGKTIKDSLMSYCVQGRQIIALLKPLGEGFANILNLFPQDPRLDLKIHHRMNSIALPLEIFFAESIKGARASMPSTEVKWGTDTEYLAKLVKNLRKDPFTTLAHAYIPILTSGDLSSYPWKGHYPRHNPVQKSRFR
ncbi:hypothetical protein An03g02350 [Aspergillus niger]|uniref:Uncharacterized protein n=2 Tax=Aspergillus niger TaxID=5061 RepID=A2QG93_ASPNC|nr:hypothetical protein An03g02350 [Aspergillus niger]CAK38203.1 hypothetical protein An03g02350 [Aspergillus niger]